MRGRLVGHYSVELSKKYHPAMKLKLTQRHAILQKLYKVSQRGRERNKDIFSS